MLPGELVRAAQLAENLRPSRTPRDWLVDVGLFVAVLLVWLVEFDETVLADAYRTPQWLAVLDAVVGLVLCGSLWWRRRVPLALGVAAALAASFSNTATGAVLVLFFSLALHRGLAQAGTVVLLALPLGLPYIFTVYASSGEDPYLLVVVAVLLVLLSAAVGLAARARRQLVSVLRLRIEESRREYERRLVQVRGDERRTMAHELHDTLAHRISLLTVHAGALEYRTLAAEDGEGPPLTAAEVRTAVGVIRTAAHSAVEELREVLEVLRHPDDPGDGVEPPRPGALRLPALFDEARAAGQHVEAAVEGDLAALRAPVQRAVFRVVQEGMTNARKHSADAPVSVTVQATDGPAEVVVEVVNPVGGAGRQAGAGVGLTGLAERVALLGGTLTHGPVDGRFVLRATIPAAP